MDHRSVLKGWRSSHVHGRTAGFVSRSDPAEDSAPVSTQIGRIQVVCTRRYGAVRSFFGGFSSTAGYVPGNEALVPKDVSGVAPFELIISLGRQPFLSGWPGSARRLILAKPFGFGSGRSRQWLSAPSVRERCVTTSVPLPDAGQNARKQSRLWSYLTPAKINVKYKIL